MEVFEAVSTLLAVRSYESRPVPPEIVRRIVEAGRLTGSSMNRQPWHFIVVENPETLRQLGALATTGPYIAQAPLAIVVAIEKTRFAVSDASRAIQSMMLTAWEAGVGSNWVGFQGLEEVKQLLGIPEQYTIPHGTRLAKLEEVKQLLGIPDHLEILAIVPFGYPAQTVGRGKKKRKALAEVAHRERFGQPLE
jgi:nitroreductase